MKFLSLILTVIYFTISHTANGQSVFPTASDSVTWTVCNTYYSSYNGEILESTTIAYHIREWTTLCGKNYSKVHSSNEVVAYIRNDSSRVYIRATSDCNDKEYLLYDFSLNVGDTVYCGWNINYSWGADTIPFWVERIDTIDIDTVNYELVYTMNLGNYPFMTWTTGYGSSFSTFYPIENYTLGGGCECSFETLCKVNFGSILSDSCQCSGTIISVSSLEDNIFQLSPNPTNGKIGVSSSSNNYSNRLSLFNTSGKIVFESDIKDNQEIDLSNLIPGLYIAIVYSEKGIIEKHKLVKL